MFEIEEYKKFLKTKVVNNTFKDYNKYVEALIQFHIAPGTYLNNTHVQYGYKKIFGDSYKNKPISVWLNRWFLHEFGYKYCTKCKLVKQKTEYGNSDFLWDKLRHECKSCEKAAIDPIKERIRNKLKRVKQRVEIQMPKWLTEEDRLEIDLIYQTAEYMNSKSKTTKYHVDHIIPITGEGVRGLHVPWNLQIIPASENLSKGNKYESEI